MDLSKTRVNYNGSNSDSRAGQEANRKGYGARGKDVSAKKSLNKNVVIGDYHLGSPTRPTTIKHDNGFLALGRVNATISDYVSYAAWQTKVDIAMVLRPDLVDATAAYQHFLTGYGASRTFSYERYVLMDQSGKKTLESAVLEIKLASYYFWLFGAGNIFSITGPAISCGSATDYPYPATENWQKAIGGHVIWLSADADIDDSGKTPEFDVDLTVHAEDRYNFNPSQHDIVTGIPDSANGRLSRAGLAQQYINTSTLSRRIQWQGKPLYTETDVSRPTLDRLGRNERQSNIENER